MVGLGLAWLGYALLTERRAHASNPDLSRVDFSFAQPQPRRERPMTEVTASIPALPSTSRPGLPRKNGASQWLPPIGLIVLSLIPVIAGAVRLNELLGGPEVTANNARFVASPIPVTVHIVSVTLYSLLGAFQFVPLLRRRKQSWHRIAGRILVPAGVLVALSGLWMSVFYARHRGDGESLVVVRLIVGAAMLASIVLAVLAIRRRDFTSHGAWMTRGLRDRARGRDPGVHDVAVGCHLRPDWRGRRAAPHGAHDGGLGDQPRGGRVHHSAAARRRPNPRSAGVRRPRTADAVAV